MIVYQCKNCEGGPCTLIIEGLGDVPTHCPWGPEGFSEWYPMIDLVTPFHSDNSKSVDRA